MADKLVQMTRTQSGDSGTFHAGCTYRETKANKSALDHYRARGFARDLTDKEVKALARRPAKAAASDTAEG